MRLHPPAGHSTVRVMARFADVLENRPAPKALGDVTLRYEPSMLIGETARGQGSWRSSLLWAAGFALLLFAVAALASQWDGSAIVSLLVVGALAMAAAVRLERQEKAQRRFVANFGTVSLRLDFTSAIAGYPRTLIVPLDSVRAAQLLPQTDGASCLCVDFEKDQAMLREVLVAHIPDSQRVEAERLERVLHGAFGLGTPPPPAEAPNVEDSSFE